MSASVANEMSGLEKAGRIVIHRKMGREVVDGLLFRIGYGAGNEGTGGYFEGNEW